jgi:glycosyltransferase involved in cell wall biosynthesis
MTGEPETQIQSTLRLVDEVAAARADALRAKEALCAAQVTLAEQAGEVRRLADVAAAARKEAKRDAEAAASLAAERRNILKDYMSARIEFMRQAKLWSMQGWEAVGSAAQAATHSDKPAACKASPEVTATIHEGARDEAGDESSGVDAATVEAAWRKGGVAAVEAMLEQCRKDAKSRANAYFGFSRTIRTENAWAALESARQAFHHVPDARHQKWLALREFGAGNLMEARKLVGALPATTKFTEWEKKQFARIRSYAKIVEPPDAPKTVDDPVSLYLDRGVDAVLESISKRMNGRPDVDVARSLVTAAGRLKEKGHVDAELRLVREALRHSRDEGTLRALYWAAQHNGDVKTAADSLIELERMIGAQPSKTQKSMISRLRRSPVYFGGIIGDIPPVVARNRDVTPFRLCYLLHNSLPYSSGGYATRAHGLAHGLKRTGWETIAITRPGYPLEVRPDLDAAEVEPRSVHDAIEYRRLLRAKRTDRPVRRYLLDAADEIEAALAELRPQAVMAASNYATALPAMIAARRRGLPFFYEVRGFWEVARKSREPGFEATTAYRVQSMLETTVANGADHVFTLTGSMREEMISRGVSTPITLLPNSCDLARFTPRVRDETLAARLGAPPGVVVIGYVGTFVQYEGLENLAEACVHLKRRGLEFRLLLVGNENPSGVERGPIIEDIVRIARTNGIEDWLILPGRVSHDEVEAYYSLIDIAAFPRKPQPVTEMVSPMKPLEALAMEKALVVSSVRALAEMIRDGETGLVFAKGDIGALSDVLARLISDPALRRRLGAAGRAWVAEYRTWDVTARIAGAELARHVTAPGDHCAVNDRIGP